MTTPDQIPFLVDVGNALAHNFSALDAYPPDDLAVGRAGDPVTHGLPATLAGTTQGPAASEVTL